jgi:hypothetical protein
MPTDPGQHEARAPLLYHPVKGASSIPSSGSLNEGSPQGGEPNYDLRARPFRPVTHALARGAGLLQPFGLLFEPRGSLQARGVGIKVFAYDPYRPRLKGSCLLNRSAVPPCSTVQISQRLLQAWRPEGSKAKTKPREFEGR